MENFGRYVKILVVRYGLALYLSLNVEVLYSLFSGPTLNLTFAILNLFYDATLNGEVISVAGHTLRFIPACVAAAAYLLLSILILLTKDLDFWMIVKLFLAGSLLIFAMNIIRLEMLMFVLLEFGKDYFDTLHLFFWKIVASVYVALVWVFLVYRFRIKEVPLYSDLRFLVNRIKEKGQ